MVIKRREETADLKDHRRGRPMRKTTPDEGQHIHQADAANPFIDALTIFKS